MGRITDRPLDAGALLGRVSGPGHGAALLFVGTVRDHAEGRPVVGMRYEGYVEMAEDVLAAILGEAEDRFDGVRVEAVHRLGELTLEEASVAIAVGSAHRAAAYEASRYVIEEIKRRLPIWKHEHFADGSAQWVAGTPLTPVPSSGKGSP